MTHRCRCPCDKLRCIDSCNNYAAASAEEQVAMVAEIGLVAAMLDEQDLEGKTDALSTAIKMLPGMSGLSDSELTLIIARAGARTEGGADWLCEVTHRIRLKPLKKLAFRMAAMFCTYDGEFNNRQQEYMCALASGFGFSDGEAERLFGLAAGLNPQP